MRISMPRQTAQAAIGWQVFTGDRAAADQRAAQGRTHEPPDFGEVRPDILARVAVEQQRIESAVHTLASGLILAQEAERKRIAGELHDGINQDVAIIAIDLGVLAQRLPDSGADIRQEVLRIQERTIALSNEIRNLSHHLHPAVVEHLGLCAALRVYCREFEKREEIKIDFLTRNVSGRYPAKVELALYRICQEALSNVRRHSGAHSARIVLQGKKGGLLLAVVDAGCGFDIAARTKDDGMGLISMWERARLAGGHLILRSQLNVGTEVEVFIPLKRSACEQT